MDGIRLSSKQIVSILFTCLILAGAFAVLRPFLLAIIWAAIIAIASWPVHVHIEKWCGGRRSLASLLSSLLICVVLVGPMVVLVAFATEDAIAVATFMVHVDKDGAPAPAWLVDVPWVGHLLRDRWDLYLASPNQVSTIIRNTLATKTDLVQTAAQFFLVGLTGRIATLVFAIWVLYFFYRDGPRVIAMIGALGNRWLGKRWSEYVIHVPAALRATVNGLVIVGFFEAVILSVLLYAVGVPSAVLLGSALAILAFVPGAAPLLLAVIGVGLAVSGQTAIGIVVFVVGLVVVLAVDYTVRPILIKGGTSLPFLAILFGIFGGVVSMGIVGVVIGPVVLVLLMVFFREATTDEEDTLREVQPEELQRAAEQLPPD